MNDEEKKYSINELFFYSKGINFDNLTNQFWKSI